MKKIVFVIGGMTRGGAERVISILANEYVEKGYKVYIVLMLDNIVQYKLRNEITIINLTGDGRGRIKTLPFWLKGLRRLIKDVKPDIIVSFVARINILVLVSIIGLKNKIIISERNDPSKDGRTVFVDLATKLLYTKADKIVFQTQRAKSYFKKNIQEKGVVISNPIEIMESAALNKKKKIVSVGRLAPQKNQKLLIDSFADISKIYPEYELWIYGEGQLRETLTAYINELHISEKVNLPGNVANIHECIKDAEIFVLSSDYEGLSNALLEAMMMGLPCISTCCAGSDEYIINNYNGKLVGINNQKELTNAMIELIKDDVVRNDIANNASKTIKEKCEKTMVIHEWHHVIKEVLE